MNGLLDDFENMFNFNTAPAGPVIPADTMASARYSVGALSVTNQALSAPNLPTTQDQLANLSQLGNILEQLTDNVGPFSILSGFRTRELQNLLSAQGEPTASGTSFHEVGRGVDIAPTSMDINSFFGMLLSNEDLKNEFAEIAIKPGQNSIHLAVNVPGDVRTTKVLGLNSDNVYTSLSIDDILAYITPFMPDAATAEDYASAELVTWNTTPLLLAGLALISAGAYLIMSRKKI